MMQGLFKKIYFLLLLTMPLQVSAQFEQYIQEEPQPTTARKAGGSFSLLESGSGIGAFYEIPLSVFWHTGINVNAYIIRDNKQYDYYHPIYGYITNKKNEVYFVDMFISLRKRLLMSVLDDSFQPFIGASAGGVYGVNFPEAANVPNQESWSFSANIESGINVIYQKFYLFGVSVFYRHINFNHQIGEKSNHSSIGIKLELGKRLK
jgi:hypothetical protein